MLRTSFKSRALPVVAALALLGCEAEMITDGTGGGGNGTLSLLVVRGNNQTGAAGEQLALPLVVKVVDPANGKPVKGQIVNFRVTAGDGSVFAGAAITNAQGLAQELWTLGTVAGAPQTVQARAVGTASGAPLVFATFQATAVAGAPASLTVIQGDNQTGSPGQPLADSLKVQVADQYGNLVAGATVAWAVTQGGGSISPTSSTTDASGVAAAEWTAGNADGMATAAVGALTTSFGSIIRDDASGFITYYRGPANGGGGAWNIYRSAPDGSGEITLLADGYDNRSADVSPDGTTILFSSNRSGNWALHTMNADGSNISSPLRVLDPHVCCGHARWSPDGTRIAFMDGWPFEIWVMQADGSNPVQVTTGGTEAHGPSWSPDGTAIAFFAAKGGVQNIYRVGVDGSGLTQLTSSNIDHWLSWCPTGRIAFQSLRTGEWGVYTMDPDGGDVQRVTPVGSGFVSPACSPTGQSLAFSSYVYNGPFGLWRAGVDGSNLHQIVAPNGYQIVGSWW